MAMYALAVTPLIWRNKLLNKYGLQTTRQEAEKS